MNMVANNGDYCDLCGKPIANYNIRNNYLKLPLIDIGIRKVDVCDKCVDKLANIIEKIFDMKGENE